MAKKVLICYYTYTGHTEKVAEIMARMTGGDLFRVTLKNPYPEDYDEMCAQVSEEAKNGTKPELFEIPDISDYDVLIFGSPTWSETAIPPIRSLLSSIDAKGKKVMAFTTHETSPGNGPAVMLKLLGVKEKGRGITFKFVNNRLKNSIKEIEHFVNKNM